MCLSHKNEKLVSNGRGFPRSSGPIHLCQNQSKQKRLTTEDVVVVVIVVVGVVVHLPSIRNAAKKQKVVD